MMNTILLSLGAVVISGWGIAHIVIPTKDIIRNFGNISEDNRRILLMEWIMEGLTLCFIGALVLCITFLGEAASPTAILVFRTAALMLVIMAGVSFVSGAKTAILPMKLCPLIFTFVAALFFVGSL